MSAVAGLKSRYDVVVIGGGVHGAAAAMEAVQRGCSVLLAERGDFCSGTSANSLRIIHGGLRYLQSGNLRRSRESAREQSTLLARAPHLVVPMPCLIGVGESALRGPAAMSLGIWFYDRVIRLGLPAHPPGRVLSTDEAARAVGRPWRDASQGALLWHDARVLDPERLVLTYLKTAETAGARVLNYASVTRVERGDAPRVTIEDTFDGTAAQVDADVVLDTGSLLQGHPHWTRAVNLVLARRPPEHAVGLELRSETEDARRLFFVTPQDQHTLVGTWYFPDRNEAPDKLSNAELESCLTDLQRLLPDLAVERGDISRVQLGRLPVADGRRPLSLVETPVIRAVGDGRRVISLTGVKYTTARAAARKALRRARLAGPAASGPAVSWYGAGQGPEAVAEQIQCLVAQAMAPEAAQAVARRLCRQYGAAAVDIVDTARRSEDGFELIPGHDAINAEIRYCIEWEHCRGIGDFILRRSGLGSLAPPAAGAAEHCGRVMARVLGWTEERLRGELAQLDAQYQYLSDGL